MKRPRERAGAPATGPIGNTHSNAASLSAAAVNVRFTRARLLLRDFGIGLHRVVDGNRESSYFKQADGVERAFDTLLELEAFLADAAVRRAKGGEQ